MKNPKNELAQFVAGIVMLAVGLFIFSAKVRVFSTWGWGYGFSFGGFNIASGLIVVPLIIGIVWMFATGASFPSKVFSGLSVLLIIVAVIMTTRIALTAITLYEWIIILVLIFGGVGFIAKVLLAGNGKSDSKKSKKKDEEIHTASSDSIDRQIEELKKKM